MAHTSINAIVAFKLKNIAYNKKRIIAPIIIGSMLPDLDFIIEYIIKHFSIMQYQLQNSIFHNIFMIPLLVLLILIYSEYKEKYNLKITALGLSIGMTFHIIFDIITLQSLGLFFPLFDSSQNFDLKEYLDINIDNNIQKILSCFEFLFFRVYGWLLIEEIILNPKGNSHLIKKIKLWMKLEIYIFLLSILFIYFGMNDKQFTNIYGILYIPSFLFALYITYKIRKTLD